MALAARPGDELPDPVGRVRDPGRGLGGKSLVVVLVSRQHDLRMEVVQGLPQWLSRAQAAVVRSAREARFVPVGEGAGVGMGGEIIAQPLLLQRASRNIDLTVEGNDVPAALVEAVVAFGRVASRCASPATDRSRAAWDFAERPATRTRA